MARKANKMEETVNNEQTMQDEAIKATAKAMAKQVAEAVEKLAEKTKEEPKVKGFQPTDVIQCRSINAGYMNFRGAKTGNVYKWSNTGDYADIEYQDLRAAMLSRSAYVFNPLFLVEDEQILELPEWKEVKAMYEKLYSKDLEEIFNLPVDQMGRVINGLPKGAKVSLSRLAKTKMENGSLDSINKIRKIDELLGTELMLFISD